MWLLTEDDARATSLVAQALGEAVKVRTSSDASAARRAQAEARRQWGLCMDALSQDAAPCPCGMTRIWDTPALVWDGSWTAVCGRCGRSVSAGTREEAVDAWNRTAGAGQ